MEGQESIKNSRLLAFKKALDGMIATSEGAYKKSNSKSPPKSHRNYTKAEIIRIVENGSPAEQAKLSETFFQTNGIYKRIIMHYATFLTYSWVVVPHLKNQKDKLSNKKLAQKYYNASDFASNFQIERKCSLWAKDILVKGAYYGIIHDNDGYVALQDLPFEYCRSRFKNQQDVDIVEFNVKFFDSISDADLRKEIIQTYPKVVQKGYYDYKNRGKNEWIYLPAELGIYHVFFDEKPFFLDLIPLLDDLEDYKEIDKRRNLLSLKRVIVQQVKTDGMNLVFEPDEAEEMHNGVLNMLSDNPDTDVITTYNNVSLLNLSGKDDDKTEIDSVMDLIFKSAGVSKEMFSSTTEAGIQFSLTNDLSLMLTLGNRFANFFTVLLNNKFGDNKIGFKLIILPVSHYNMDEYASKAKDLAAFGYSFIVPSLGSGFNQNTLKDIKSLENDLLKLSDSLTPLQSAYTQSSKQITSTNAVTAKAASDTAKVVEEKDEEKVGEEDNADNTD